MAEREIHIELLVGRRVLGPAGRSVGRLEEIMVEQIAGEYVVREYLVGSYALFERLSAWGIARALLKLLGAGPRGGYKVPWDKMDLSDEKRPRLKCPVQELEKLNIK